MKSPFQTLLCLLVILLPATSFSQELKICEEGIKKCQPLIKDSTKYSKCMRLMCYDYYSEKDKKLKNNDSKYYFKYVEEEKTKAKKQDVEDNSEEAKTCEYGLRKCDVLRNIPEYYWECISDSCKNPSNDPPNCPLGQNMCLDTQKIYNDCMKFTCGSATADFDSCKQARFSCNESLRSYWHCVYNICLGSVDQYKRPPSSIKYMVVQDAKGKKRRVQVNRQEPVMSGAPAWGAPAPRGVDPVEWSQTTPQKFLINGNPSDYMQCMLPTALLDCSQNDMRSCRCSDGTVPIVLYGVPSPVMDSH